jgi:hypothetical protein
MYDRFLHVLETGLQRFAGSHIPVLRIRIQTRIRMHRIHMFLGLPDPRVTGMDPDPALDPDPDPSIIKKVRKTLIPTIL